MARWVCDGDKKNHTNLEVKTLILNIKTHDASQRSLHNAPIFRLLLKVAVNGTHQCDFFNFCGALWVPTVPKHRSTLPACTSNVAHHHHSLESQQHPMKNSMSLFKKALITHIAFYKSTFPVLRHPCGRGNSAISDA